MHVTPVLTCETFDRWTGARLFFKCENLQKTGSFKFRGASHAVSRLDPAARGRGVVTHSSGNHAQALAHAAQRAGIPAVVVMPRDSSAVKRAAVEGYGARVVLCEPNLAARESTAARLLEETGATFVHPYENLHVIAGQGTAALELMEAVPDLEMVIAPLGGGGLFSGTALAVKDRSPGAQVWGVEPEAADDGRRGLEQKVRQPATGNPTIADGLRTAVGEAAFRILGSRADGIVTVSEAAIARAFWAFFERMKMVVEPSGAVGLAALLEGRLEARGRRIGLILSGGNVDPASLPPRVAQG